MTHSTRFRRYCLGAIVVILALVGCGGREATPIPATSVASSVTVPPATPLPPLPPVEETGSTENPLSMYLLVDDPSEVESAADELASELSAEAGLSIRVVLTQDPAVALAALCDGQAAAATLDALTYLTAQEAGCGDLLYQVETDGEVARQGQIISLSDRIFTLPNVRDRIFCRNEDDLMIGWVEPVLALQANGIDPFAELGSVVDAEDDAAVLENILDLTCDVGVTRIGAQESLDDPEAIGIIYEMASVPRMGFVLSSGLSDDHRAALEDGLDGTRSELASLLGGDALVEGDDVAYDDLRELFESAGVDGLALSQ